MQPERIADKLAFGHWHEDLLIAKLVMASAVSGISNASLVSDFRPGGARHEHDHLNFSGAAAALASFREQTSLC